MLRRTALGVPRFSITRPRLSFSTLRKSWPKFDRACRAEITRPLFFAVFSAGIKSPVRVIELYSCGVLLSTQRLGRSRIRRQAQTKRETCRDDQAKWRDRDSSNAFMPFQAICTPIQTRKNDDNWVITVMPVAPRIRAKRSANP